MRAALYFFIFLCFIANPSFAEGIPLIQLKSDIGILRFKSEYPNDKELTLKVLGEEGNYISFRINQNNVRFELNNESEFQVQSEVYQLDKKTDEIISQYILKFKQNVISLYVDEKVCFRIQRPFFKIKELQTTKTCLGSYQFKDFWFQKVSEYYFNDDFQIAEGDENQLDAWEIFEGEWNVHSAQEIAEEEDIITDKSGKKLENKRSPNLYSLKGKSEEGGVIVSGYPFYDQYIAESSLKLQKNAEAGLVFLCLDEENYYVFSTFIESKSDKCYATLWKQVGETQVLIRTIEFSSFESQWHRLKAKISFNRIQCFIDDTKVLDINEHLPSGGQFGLYVKSNDNVLFDEFKSFSHNTLHFDSVERMKMNLISEKNVIHQNKVGSFFNVDKDKKDYLPLFSKPMNGDHYCLFGSLYAKHKELNVSLDLVDNKVEFNVVFDYKNHNQFKLLEIKTNQNQLSITEKSYESEIKIELDKVVMNNFNSNHLNLKVIHDKGSLQLYNNDTLLYVSKSSYEKLAFGLGVTKGNVLKITSLSLNDNQKITTGDLKEKNKIFQDDPYMKHWASPEGAWLPDKNKEGDYWFKSDLIGQVDLILPLDIQGSFNLFVPEGKEEPEILIRFNEKGVSLMKNFNGLQDSVIFIAVHELSNFIDKELKLNFNQNWVWGSIGDQKVRLFLQEKLKGNRLKISGVPDKRIKDIVLHRHNVLDIMFNSPLHDWAKNGGEWRVINRFNCDPRWSHMNGESKETLASLWSKYKLEGDFCLEMYAGMRHNWYDRVGDINLTLLNQNDSISDGYTFINTGWDVNFSQQLSRLLLNGETLQTSDLYLLPRYRSHNKRKFRSHLIRKGRDVHGAWYYFKVRRVGKKIEYYFDNEKVFEIYESEAISKGGFGVWTYQNSIMVARIKLTADNISKKKVSFKPTSKKKLEEYSIIDEEVEKDDSLPLELKHFSMSDNIVLTNNVGIPVLTTLNSSELGSGFKIYNRSEDGPLNTSIQLEYPFEKTLAWRFDFLQKNNAKVNFYFHLVTKVNGKDVIKDKFYYPISGDEGEELSHKVILPNERDMDKIENGEWVTVTVPVPRVMRHGLPLKNAYWKLVGFGLQQASDFSMGIKGNRKGSEYQIKDFRPVFSVQKNYDLNIKEIEFKKIKIDKERYQNIKLAEYDFKGKSYQLEVVPHEQNHGYECVWSTDKAYQLHIRPKHDLLSVENWVKSVRVNGEAVPIFRDKYNVIHAYIPAKNNRENNHLYENKSFEVSLVDGKNKIIQLEEILWSTMPKLGKPRLATLTGMTPHFWNFENMYKLNNGFSMDSEHHHLVQDEFGQISYQRLNTGYWQRLIVNFGLNASYANYPMLYFNYKHSDVSDVSILPKSHRYIKFSEKDSRAIDVEYKKEIVKGQWSSWTGLMTDFLKKEVMDLKVLFSKELTFKSIESHDQTGRRAKLELDNVVLGPIISSKEQMKFKTEFVSAHGIQSCFYAVVSSPEFNDKNITNAHWKLYKNKREIIPEIEMKSGNYFFLLKAKDKLNIESDIVKIPFIINANKSDLVLNIEESNDFRSNGPLVKVKFKSNNHVLPKISDLKITINDKKIKYSKFLSSIKKSNDHYKLTFNPFYVAKQSINKLSHQDNVHFKITNIRDGSGLKYDNLKFDFKIDHEKDKQPPTFFYPTYRDGLLFDFIKSRKDKINHNMHHLRQKTTLLSSRDFSPRIKFEPKNKGYGRIYPRQEKVSSFEYISLKIRSLKQDKNKEDKESISGIDFKKFKMYLKVITKDRYHFKIPLFKMNKKGVTSGVLNLDKDGWQKVIINFWDIVIKQGPKKIKDHRKKQIETRNKLIENGSELEKLEPYSEEDIQNMIKKMKYHYAELLWNEVPKGIYFELENFDIFGATKTNKNIYLDAYDQSGIDRMNWEWTPVGAGNSLSGNTKKMRFEHKETKIPKEELGWMKFNFTDKASNTSYDKEFPLIYQEKDDK